jgi:hypothetical protein
MASKYIQKFPIPEGFPEILSDFAKEILRNRPKDIYEFSAEYFRCLQEKVVLDYNKKGDNLPNDFKTKIPTIEKAEKKEKSTFSPNETKNEVKQETKPEKKEEPKVEQKEIKIELNNKPVDQTIHLPNPNNIKEETNQNLNPDNDVEPDQTIHLPNPNNIKEETNQTLNPDNDVEPDQTIHLPNPNENDWDQPKPDTTIHLPNYHQEESHTHEHHEQDEEFQESQDKKLVDRLTDEEKDKLNNISHNFIGNLWEAKSLEFKSKILLYLNFIDDEESLRISQEIDKMNTNK